MSYTFLSDRRYRMPTHFGPSLGPRQGPDGKGFSGTNSTRDVLIQATFEAEAAQLENFLPPGFSLRQSDLITLSFAYATNIAWLAGRGYSTFGVSIPASYSGQQDQVAGDLLLIFWENMADPIITGREDLGFAKLYCEIPDPQFIGDKVICRASWDGCQFAQLELTDLKQVAPDALPESELSDGTLHYKYIPKTGCPGEADVEYAVLTPADDPYVNTERAMVAETAHCQFRHSTWEELPTLVNIVNAFAELRLGPCVEATVLNTQGGKDLSDQRILY